MSVLDKCITWTVTLIVTMLVVAEVVWEVPVKLFLVDICNDRMFIVSKDVIWSDPQDAADIGPAGHVAAVDEDDIVLVCLQ